MKIAKGYRLLRFLNRKHHALWRYSLAMVGWLGTLIATRSLALAYSSYQDFGNDKFAIAFRKAARHARYLNKHLNVLDDPFFDFTQNSTQKERAALYKCLARYKNNLPKTQYLTDILYLKAADIHALLENGQQAEVQIDDFYTTADKVLELASKDLAANRKQTTFAKKPVAQNFNKQEAKATLQDLATTLPNKQWPWYVISGTFLGLHREGGFLAHDYDIDIGIDAEHTDPEDLLQTLRASTTFVVGKLDYYVEVVRNKAQQRHIKKRLSIIKLVHTTGMQVDVFIHYTEKGKTWHGSSIHRWDNTPFELQQRTLEGVPVYAPKDADTYLEENYGNWQVPVKAYDCTTGTPNLAVAPNFISIALFTKHYAFEVCANPKQAKKLISSLHGAGLISSTQTPKVNRDYV